jgi:hypothetical protein
MQNKPSTLLNKHSPYFYCVVSFVVTFIVSLRFFFLFEPTSFSAPSNLNTSFVLHIYNVTPFASSTLGLLVFVVFECARDIVFVAIEVGLNIASVVLLRRHLAKKSKLITTSAAATSARNILCRTDRGAAPAQSNRSHSVAKSKSITVNKMNKANIKAAKMAIFTIFISTIMHLLSLLFIIFEFFDFDDDFKLNWVTAVDAVLAIRHSMNILILAGFNSNFKKSLIKIVKRQN